MKRSHSEPQSIADVQERFRLLRAVNLDKISDDELDWLVADAMTGHMEWVGSYSINSIYRARPWTQPDLPTDISELVEPPPHSIRSHGRLNMPGHAILYASEISHTAVNEIAPKVGDRVLLSEFERRKNAKGLYLSQLGEIIDDISGKLPPREEEIRAKVGGQENYAIVMEIRRQLRNLLREPIPREHPQRYRITAQLAKSILDNLPDIDGFHFPSVAMNGWTVNLAIRPHAWRREFRVSGAALLEILKLDVTSHHVITHKTSMISENGSLPWNDDIEIKSPNMPAGYGIDVFEKNGKSITVLNCTQCGPIEMDATIMKARIDRAVAENRQSINTANARKEQWSLSWKCPNRDCDGFIGIQSSPWPNAKLE